MRSNRIRNRNQSTGRTWALLSCAIAATVSSSVFAADEFVISTSGATALGAFTRMNNNANSPTNATINRGPLAVGGTITIGSTTYNLQPGISYLGIANLNSADSSEPTLAQDRLLYYYRESGSVQGILDLVDSNGLRAATPGVPIRPGDPAANLFLWVNGSRFNSVASGFSAGTTPNTIAGTPNTGRVNGRNYTTGSLTVAEDTPNGQPLVRIAWSDVRFEQAFSVAGVSTFAASPTGTGYGLGRGNIGGTNFQRLRAASSIDGGTDPSTTKLRNESIAVVPFNLVANPGTGLAELTKEQAAWIQMAGRLSNGANFNSVTREIGSGTRNQGDLNLGVDPSWGGGERDRLATASYSTFDADGNVVQVNIGDEADPARSLAGSTVQDINENRISPNSRFSDKISGSSGVRATVVASRMGMGILSAGDSRDNANGSALASVAATTASPMRALKIDWDNAGPKTGTQATAANVATGDYEMWSASQAITVAPYANPTANDVAGNAYRPIAGDLNDQNVGSATNSSEPGVHRKFLDNITKSVTTYTAGASSSLTPADFIIQSAFIPPQLMKVTKTYDGGTYSSRTLNASEQALYNEAITSGSGVLNQQTAWADPSTMNGGLGVNAVSYKIFATANTGGSPNRTVVVKTRTNLAGDFNGDTVRDIEDVPAVAYAYANPDAYLATPASGDVNGRNYNGTAVNSTSTGTNANTRDGLIVLSDFNSNGNVTTDTNNGSFATTAIERKDVRYFLYGATVDTSAYNTGVDPAKNRRENGVRYGTLKKNQAIDTFNTALASYVGLVTNPATGLVYTSGEIDALKFNKFDVNGDDKVNRLDAKIVDRNVGKNYTVLSDVLSTNDDLVAADFQDNLTVTYFLDSGTSDFKMIRDALGSSGLLDGDANFDGVVDISDLYTVASHWQNPSTKWSDGDFNYDGVVNAFDLTGISLNWQANSAVLGPQLSLGTALTMLNLASVPEPTSIGLLGLGAMSVLARRRRLGN